MKEIYEQVAAQADVTVYGFSDDANVVGTPAEAMKALAELQRLLPTVSLQCNTAKSHFVYFHEEAAPLMRSVRQTLATHDIQLLEHWIEYMGAVIGRDDDAIRAGVAATFGADSGLLPTPAARGALSAERDAAAATVRGPSAQPPAALRAAAVHR
jgi:hypothetical protein